MVVASESVHSSSSEQSREKSQASSGLGPVNKRSKERRIDFVIEKVKMWRRLFNGVPD